MAAPKRYRHWTTVLYPESCAENWRSLLDEDHIQYAVSPLHEFDFNPDGEIKKPHWHIAFVFDGVKSYDQIAEICNKIKAVSPQKVLCLRGLIRYFCHLDNPEKHQYFVGDIEAHNGLDIDDCLKHTQSEENAMITDILDFIDERNITEFWALLSICRKEKPEWLDVLYKGHTILITAALNSRRQIIKENKKYAIS